jgi:hypothetical protein
MTGNQSHFTPRLAGRLSRIPSLKRPASDALQPIRGAVVRICSQPARLHGNRNGLSLQRFRRNSSARLA